MELRSNNLEFDVLGFKVKVRPDEDTEILPEHVVKLVQEEALSITKRFPQLEPGRVATLVALKLATDKLKLDKEFRQSVHEFERQAREALSLIDQNS